MSISYLKDCIDLVYFEMADIDEKYLSITEQEFIKKTSQMTEEKCFGDRVLQAKTDKAMVQYLYKVIIYTRIMRKINNFINLICFWRK